MNPNVGLTTLAHIDLTSLFALLDPDTGKWEIISDRLRQNVAQGRTEETMQRVYDRLKKLEEIPLTQTALRLFSYSANLTYDYKHVVIGNVRREICQHIRYVRAIQIKAQKRLDDRFQWLTDVSIIGYLFHFTI